jgi:hypothetical protein
MINNKEEEIKEKREKALMTPRFSFLWNQFLFCTFPLCYLI